MANEYLKLKTCEIMQYFEFYDTNDIYEIEKRIKSLTDIKTYCIVIHDKDKYDDGTDKGVHFHAVLTFENAVTSLSISKSLNIAEQYVQKIRTTTKAAQLYLIHANDVSKYRYSVADVVANFDYKKLVEASVKSLNRFAIAEKINSGEIKQYNINKYVSIDEYARNKVYYERCFEYRIKAIKGNERKMECVFITGASGTGKTTYAKSLAQSKGYSTYISSGGKNPLDNYAGQECIILDDLRDSTYKLSDFLKLTDNNTDSLVGCRFYNKSIAECKLLIVTSIKSIYDFYKETSKEDKEPQQQLFRRFNTYIEMGVDQMTFHGFNERLKLYEPVIVADNPVAYLFAKEEKINVFIQNMAKATGLKIVKSYGDDNKIPFSEYTEEELEIKKRW